MVVVLPKQCGNILKSNAYFFITVMFCESHIYQTIFKAIIGDLKFYKMQNKLRNISILNALPITTHEKL